METDILFPQKILKQMNFTSNFLGAEKFLSFLHGLLPEDVSASLKPIEPRSKQVISTFLKLLEYKSIDDVNELLIAARQVNPYFSKHDFDKVVEFAAAEFGVSYCDIVDNQRYTSSRKYATSCIISILHYDLKISQPKIAEYFNKSTTAVTKYLYHLVKLSPSKKFDSEILTKHQSIRNSTLKIYKNAKT